MLPSMAVFKGTLQDAEGQHVTMRFTVGEDGKLIIGDAVGVDEDEGSKSAPAYLGTDAIPDLDPAEDDDDEEEVANGENIAVGQSTRKPTVFKSAASVLAASIDKAVARRRILVLADNYTRKRNRYSVTAEGIQAEFMKKVTALIAKVAFVRPDVIAERAAAEAAKAAAQAGITENARQARTLQVVAGAAQKRALEALRAKSKVLLNEVAAQDKIIRAKKNQGEKTDTNVYQKALAKHLVTLPAVQELVHETTEALLRATDKGSATSQKVLRGKALAAGLKGKDNCLNSSNNGFFMRAQKAWVTAEVMASWIKNVLLPYREELVKRHGERARTKFIVLIMDRCSVHATETVIELLRVNRVHVIWVVANMTGKLQPLDVSVMRSAKAKVKAVNETRRLRQLVHGDTQGASKRRDPLGLNNTERQQLLSIVAAGNRVTSRTVVSGVYLC